MSYTRVFIFVVAAAAATGVLPLSAQSQDADASEDTIQLSAFVVNTEADNGYQATETISGTRTGTSLRDISSVVSPLTKDFLADIDATNLQDAILFVPGVDEDPRPYNSGNNNPVSTRIRGFTNTNNLQDYFTTDVTVDVYNIERIDLNRGPNSILYGIGSPGGGYSAVTKDARFRNFGEFQTRFEDTDSWRFSMDLNQQIVKGKLAIRLAAMSQDDKSFRQPSSTKETRLYGALNYLVAKQPNYEASFRVKGEKQTADASVPAWNTATNFVTAWQDAGSPTISTKGTVAGAFQAGTQQIGSSNNIIVINDSAVAVPTFIYGRRASSAVTRIPGTTISARLGVPGVGDAFIPGTSDVLPAELNYFGLARGYTQDSHRVSAFFDQTFFKNIAVQVAYYRQNSERNWQRQGGGGDVRVDVMEFLPDGTPNPNVGKLYTDGIFRDQPQQRIDEVFRISASGEWDLTEKNRWLGRHRLALLYEDSSNVFGLNDRYEVNVASTQFASNLNAGANRIVRRSYLFAGSGNTWLNDTKYRDVAPVSGTIATGSASQAGRDYQSGFVNSRIVNQEAITKSWVAALQSFFLDDRLVLFGGIRGDKLQNLVFDQAYVTANTVSGVLPDWRSVPLVSNPSSDLNETTPTYGVIVRPFKWLDIFYNRSEVLATGASRSDVFDRPLPFPNGEGFDTGVRWSLFNGQLTGSVSYYEASQQNIPDFQAQTIITQLENFTSGLDQLAATPGSGVPVGNYKSLDVVRSTNSIDTLDNTAHGLEAEIVYNPSRSWRIALKAARFLNSNTNVQDRTLAYWNEKIYPLRSSLPGSAVLPTTGDTITEAFEDFDQQFNNIKYSREGTLQARLSEWSYSAVTNYQFFEGFLKGFSVGGSFRYNSSPFLSALIDGNTRRFTGQYVRSPSRSIVGLNLGYQWALSSKRTLDFRFAVSNLFDKDEFEPISADSRTGVVSAVRPMTPRAWSFTTTFKF
jgi:iron complex outermembrane recepter protein